jgi:hypothetical protein
VISFGGRFGYKDAAETPNTQVVIFNYGARTIISETRGLKTDPFDPKFKGGSIFYGSQGVIAGGSVFDLQGNLVRTFEGKSENHFANFLKAVRSRKRSDLRAEIEEGHQSAALCHLGNISYRLGQPASPAEIKERLAQLKLKPEVLETFERTERHLAGNGVDLAKTRMTLGAALQPDSGKERFVKNSAADSLLGREYRAPFTLPAESQL